jgi:hypothetical protein
MKKTHYDAKLDLKPAKAFNQTATKFKAWHHVNPLPLIKPRLRKAAYELIDDLKFIDGRERNPFDLYPMMLNYWLQEVSRGPISRIELAAKIVDSQKYGTMLDHQSFKQRDAYVDRLLAALGVPKDLLN